MRDLVLLLIKKDNTLEKRSFSVKKRLLGLDGKLKKTNYCRKHWTDLNSLNRLREQVSFSCQEERNNLENCIVNSPLTVGEKEKLSKRFQLSETKEFSRKIVNSLVDSLISQEVVSEQMNKIFQVARGYQKFLQMRQSFKGKLEEVKEQIKSCPNCQKYCNEHQEKIISHSQKCSHCFGEKNVEDVSILEKDIKTVEEQFKNEIAVNRKGELERVLSALKKKRVQVNEKNFSLRRACPLLMEYRRISSLCVDCQKQTQKKHLVNIRNPIERVFLINNDKDVKPEIYLLTEDKTACLYNKRDLAQFLISNGRYKALLRDKSRSIAYIDIKSS